MNAPLRDPMGLLLAAARVDPRLMQAARQVESELARLHADAAVMAEQLGHYKGWFGDDCRCTDGECPL